MNMASPPPPPSAAVAAAVLSPSGKVLGLHQLLPPATGEQQPLLDGRVRFLNAKPRALGTVQIVVGVLTLLFGVTEAIRGLPLAVLSGAFGWGPLLYMASGSVTVAAEKSLSKRLINASLVLNITAAGAAVSAMALYIADAVLYHPYQHYNPGYMIVLALFQFLQLVVSLMVTGYACKVTCCSEQPLIIVQTVDGASSTQTPPSYQAASASAVQPPQVEIFFKNPAELESAVPPPYESSS